MLNFNRLLAMLCRLGRLMFGVEVNIIKGLVKVVFKNQ